ncbi:catabolite control protein A [Streptococcus pneumoniae]|nr:catabolite control protein A [Streptococcus pneumoniae]
MNADDTVTIYDVAREAGVSMATVSRVVNGNKYDDELYRLQSLSFFQTSSWR